MKFCKTILSLIPAIKKREERWEKISDLLVKISEMQNELKENAAMFKAIFCINPIAMVIVGLDDAVLYDANSTFEELSGYKLIDSIGKSVYELGLYVDVDDRHRIVAKIIENGFVRHEPVKFIMQDGRTHECLLSSKVIVRGGKKLIVSAIVDSNEIGKLQ